MILKGNQKQGLTLTELFCVMAILAILAALYLGPIFKAFVRIKKLLFGVWCPTMPSVVRPKSSTAD